MPWIEVRTYELVPGGFERLRSLFEAQVAPLLERWEHDVVHAGGSPHDPDSFILVRAYADEADRRARQDAFYGGAEWREGPREAMLALIGGYTSGVLPMSEETLSAWRRELASLRQGSSS